MAVSERGCAKHDANPERRTNIFGGFKIIRFFFHEIYSGLHDSSSIYKILSE
jgi:hypothetical protein